MQKLYSIRSFMITMLVVIISLISVTANSAELLAKDWDNIVKQAKKEGEVVWYQWYFQPEFRKITKAFEKEYGIKVSIPDVASICRYASAGRYSAPYDGNTLCSRERFGLDTLFFLLSVSVPLTCHTTQSPSCEVQPPPRQE